MAAARAQRVFMVLPDWAGFISLSAWVSGGRRFTPAIYGVCDRVTSAPGSPSHRGAHALIKLINTIFPELLSP